MIRTIFTTQHQQSCQVRFHCTQCYTDLNFKVMKTWHFAGTSDTAYVSVKSLVVSY